LPHLPAHWQQAAFLHALAQAENMTDIRMGLRQKQEIRTHASQQILARAIPANPIPAKAIRVKAIAASIN